MWQRTHSLSNTQKVLDDAIRDLEEYIAEDLASLQHQRCYSSNDSAVGGSEAVVSPLQLDTTHSEPSTLNRNGQVHDSVDSAFSNYSSPTNSSEGMHRTDLLLVESENEVTYNHIRMSSEVSNTSAVSPISRQDSPDQPISIEASSLPSLTDSDKPEKETKMVEHSGSHTLPPQGRQHTSETGSRHSKKRKNKTSVTGTGTYSYHRSPILSYKMHHLSESQLDSSDHTPTDSTSNITSSPSGFSLDSSHLQGTVI